MYSSVRTGLGTEATGRAFLFIQSEIAFPGKGALRAGLDAGFWITGHAEFDLFLFRPVGADPDSRTFGSDTPFMSDGANHLTDTTTRAQRRNGFDHGKAPKAHSLNPKQISIFKFSKRLYFKFMF